MANSEYGQSSFIDDKISTTELPLYLNFKRVTETLIVMLTLAVIPAIYALVKQWRLGRGLEH